MSGRDLINALLRRCGVDSISGVPADVLLEEMSRVEAAVKKVGPSRDQNTVYEAYAEYLSALRSRLKESIAEAG